jgi:hypothetical protein
MTRLAAVKEGKTMKIYIICPVRNGVPEGVAEYVAALESQGHVVHFPPRDAPQDDPTGNLICHVHREAMMESDRVDVFWDVNSKGSHFDLGMAYAFFKPIKIVVVYQPDTEGKSYVKVMMGMK